MKKKKIEFELWWLWIPVMVFSFFKGLQTEDILIGGVLMSLFVVSIIGVAMHPRKPRVIYSHLNTMLRYVFWHMTIGMLVILWSIFGLALLGLLSAIPDWLLPGWGVVIVIFVNLTLVYFVYWSRPYSRKRSGIAAVDAAIARYRMPGEIVQSQWMPDMVVDGGRYRVAAYFKDEHSDATILGFTLDGRVVREEALMSKILKCMKLAGNIMHPQSINFRTEAYKNTKKGIQLAHKALREWNRIFRNFPAEYAEEVQWLRRGIEMVIEFGEGMCAYWYLEAEYGMRHGNTRMKEVRYEDVEWLNSQVEAHRREQGRLEAWEAVFRAVRILSNFLYEQPQYRTRERAALLEVIENMDIIREIWQLRDEGIVAGPYVGMTSDIRARWLPRLAWVDLADSWAAQGYEGKALEAKKREYLAEQARLEAERKRQEEAERERRRQEKEAEKARRRKARRAQRKAQATESQEAGGKA